MKKLILTLLLSVALIGISFSEPGRHSSSHHKSSSSVSKASATPKGRYVGSSGSSHKGGHFVRPSTGNNYKHKK